ncbi:MAG TPA: serine hydrolase [Pseudomonadota bacterium]|nr:serine hydrolase [Pseudomonadota bacterium]
MRRLLLTLGAAVLVCGLACAAQGTCKPSSKKAAVSENGKRASKKKQSRRLRERLIPTYARNGLPNIQARAAVVVDLTTGQPLFQKNPDEVRPIASISKLLAMLVVLDHKLNFEAASTISQDDARRTVRGAKSRLLVGFALSNRDLFHAALMASDNRAVLALGRSVGLSPTEFAREMTAKAQSLGLRKTTFHDPTGLDYGNVSSPRETVAMLLAALKNPLIAKAVKTRTYVAKTLGAKKRTIDYSNTDVLLASRHEIFGGKTGYNDQAGYCLVVAARIAGAAGKSKEVAMAFLGEEGKMTRFADFGRTAQWLVEKHLAEPAQKSAKLAAATRRARTR